MIDNGTLILASDKQAMALKRFVLPERVEVRSVGFPSGGGRRYSRIIVLDEYDEGDAELAHVWRDDMLCSLVAGGDLDSMSIIDVIGMVTDGAV